MTNELEGLPLGGTDEGLFLSTKGTAARDYVNARREIKIDVKHTAVVSLHIQKSTAQLTGVTDEMMDRVAAVLNGARQAGMLVIHQTTQFRKGYPEVSPRNRTLSNVKKTGVLQPGMSSAELHAKAAALPGDIIAAGSRGSGFFGSDMESVLKANDITCLVLFGISTGGAVNLTMGYGFDLDYELVMLEDCCADTDMELHRVLFRQLFPRRATVMTAQEFLQVIGVA